MVKEIEMKKFILATVILLMASSLAFGATVVEDETKDTRAKPVSLYVKTGTDVAPIGYDTTVSAVVAIDVAHREIHEGNTYTAFISDLALADDASITMLLTTGDALKTVSVSGHITLQYASGGDAQIFIYETPTVVTIGTPFTAVRLNREISSTAGTTVSTGATCSSYGTLIYDSVIAGGTGGNAGGGAGSHDDEFIFTPATQYLIRLENEAGATKVAGIHVNWYEE